MPDNQTPQLPDGHGFTAADLRAALAQAVVAVADDTAAIALLTDTTAQMCSQVYLECYEWDDWDADDDRETVVHVTLTLERMCRHLTLGLDLLAQGHRDEAWTILGGAAGCRTEIDTALRLDRPVDDETTPLATLLDATEDDVPYLELLAATSERDDEPADATGMRITLTGRARLRRTPGLFLDEDRLQHRYRHWALALLTDSLTDIADLGEQWSIPQLVEIRDIITGADSVRIAHFHRPHAA